MIPRKKCNTTGKTIFLTKGDAKTSMLNIKSHNQHRGSYNRKRKAEMKRVYYCQSCKGYHLTSFEVYNSRKANKTINHKMEKMKFFDGFDVEKWKSDSLPFPEDKIKKT